MATKQAPATDSHEWDEVQPFTEPVQLEPGESLIGTYLGANEILLNAQKGDDGAEQVDGEWKRRALLHEIATGANGDDPTGLWGSAGLDRRLADVPSGAVIKVQYDGMRSLEGGRQVRQYRVWVDKTSNF